MVFIYVKKDYFVRPRLTKSPWRPRLHGHKKEGTRPYFNIYLSFIVRVLYLLKSILLIVSLYSL